MCIYIIQYYVYECVLCVYVCVYNERKINNRTIHCLDDRVLWMLLLYVCSSSLKTIKRINRFSIDRR